MRRSRSWSTGDMGGMRGFDDLALYPPGDLELDAFDDDFFPADDDRAGLSPTVAPVAATVGVLLLPAAPAARVLSVEVVRTHC